MMCPQMKRSRTRQKDYGFWQTLLMGGTLAAAIWIGHVQNRISQSIYRTQDAVELFADCTVKEARSPDDKVASRVPVIRIQNAGTRVVYLDEYKFNGKLYPTDGQNLPPSYGEPNNIYWIELPTNGESHVSLKIVYHDQEGRYWTSEVFAERHKMGSNPDALFEWKARTLPRVQGKNPKR